MAGIYIHIPFCKQRCSYCDFFTRVAPLKTDAMVAAIAKELILRKDFLKTNTINTVYFGGGTPSLLSAEQFSVLLEAIYSQFSVLADAEITFEANPEDLDAAFFESVAHLPFNRISMGIQSFDDHQLKSVNRRHSGQQAIDAFHNARKAGFSNISIDLIYGLPQQSSQSWKNQLQQALALRPEHISVYGLTYEKGTPLYKQAELGKVLKVPDDEMARMHLYTLDVLSDNGYEAYEISNHALPGFQSRHNSSYWNLTPYLGLGPSAHSFDGNSRHWNVASINDYIENVTTGASFSEFEVLTDTDKYNEYIMLSLRTLNGVSVDNILQGFEAKISRHFNAILAKYQLTGFLKISGDTICLSPEGVLISNKIIEDFMFVE